MRDSGIGAQLDVWIIKDRCVIDDLAVRNRKQFTLVMEINRLARMSEEDGVSVIAMRLHGLDRVVSFGNGIRLTGFIVFIERVNLLTQNCAFERSDRLTRVLFRKIWRKHGIVEKHCVELVYVELASKKPSFTLAIVLIFEMARDALARKICSSVKPGLGQRGGQIEGFIEVCGRR